MDLVDLSALNKSSAKLASYAVRLAGGRVNQYTYTSKKDNACVTQNKFEVYLVGKDPQAYLLRASVPRRSGLPK